MKSPRRVWWLCVASAAIWVLISLADAKGFRRYLRLRKEIAALSLRKQQLDKENRALGMEIRSLREDPAAIEQAAREELGYIKPGEIILNLE